MLIKNEKPHCWGHRFEERGQKRFVFWHRYVDHLIQVSGYYYREDVRIDSVKRGIQFRSSAGLPHFGYAFEWKEIYSTEDPQDFISLGMKLNNWLLKHP